MPIIRDAQSARLGRQAVNVKGFTQSSDPADSYYATMYMGAPPSTAPSEMRAANVDREAPQAYLVEQPRRATVPPHFHDTDQFQVFVAGAASFGKDQVEPVTVHYAGGHTPYGPIVTAEEGTHYFTLRRHWDSGGKPMPGSRDQLRAVPRCHRMSDPVDPADLPAGHSMDLIPAEPNGLGARLFAVTGAAQATLDFDQPGAGQYLLVLDGEAAIDGTQLTTHACLFRAEDEPAFSLTTGSKGARLLLMQFPAGSSTPEP
ncbi:MAG: hypothetical protein RIM84_24770 [Alphaproteobacteria bacterium]